MKLWKKILTSILTAALLMGTCGTTVLASAPAEKAAYTYTVTFYAGNQGSFNGTSGLTVSNENAVVTTSAEKIVVSGLAAGDKVGLTAQSAVKLASDSKYYVQGIRVSGRDNDTVAASVFEVKGDADYVTAYGIKGNQVKYTIKYQNEKGESLSADEVFYGNVGDKPVVAYKYIDGYFPKAFGLTKTLSANEAENVFVFVYTDMPQTTINQVIKEEIITQVTGGGVTVIGGGAGGNAGGADEGDGETGEEQEAGGADEETGAETGDSESEGSDIIVDLDDEEVPLAENDKTDSMVTVDDSMKTYAALVAVGVAALIVLVILLVYLKKKSKKTEE